MDGFLRLAERQGLGSPEQVVPSNGMLAKQAGTSERLVHAGMMMISGVSGTLQRLGLLLDSS